MPYPEFFWAYRYTYQEQDFNESIEEHTIRKTARQTLWPYLAAFQCQTTKQSDEIIRSEEWTVIKLIKVKKIGEVFENLGSFFGNSY